MASRAVIAILILGSLNFYAAFQLIMRWPWPEAPVGGLWAFTALFFALQLFAPFSDRLLLPRYYKVPALARLFRALDFLSYAALGLFSCLFVYLVAAELIGLAAKLVWQPANTPSFDRNSYRVLAAVTLGTGALGIAQAKAAPAVTRVAIPLPNLPPEFDGFTIAQVSDLHVGPTIGRAYVEQMVGIVNGLKPDLIALTGDFIDGPVAQLRDELLPIANLQAVRGVFYITGNHEYYWGPEAWMEQFRRMGTHVLVNEHVLIERDGAKIVLAGVTDYSTVRMKSPHASDPQRAAAGAPAGLVKILLAHQPASYVAAAAAGFDLQLSGHTHGGQYFPLTLFIGWFQKYYKGLNRHGTMWLYVNRGTGYWGPPLRTANAPEITLLTLTRDRAA